MPITARYFDKDYWVTPFTKSGYSVSQGWTKDDYLTCAEADFFIQLFGTQGKWLEAGCALGWVVGHLRQRNVDVAGFDISKYAIKHAEPDVKQHLKRSDGMSSKLYPAESFDIVYSMETGEHVYIDDVEKWLSNLNHWLKPGGILFMTLCLGNNNVRGLSDPDESHQTLQPRLWWNSLLDRAGFREDLSISKRASEIVVDIDGMPAPEQLVPHYQWHVFTYRKG